MGENESQADVQPQDGPGETSQDDMANAWETMIEQPKMEQLEDEKSAGPADSMSLDFLKFIQPILGRKILLPSSLKP